jgi:acyl phosphate:glycerol-3-phosphate acyltransferase
MIAYFVLSYLIGNMMTGYIIVKLLGKQDIRLQGSGNVGARNAGRLYGKAAFILTFLGDALKGAVVVLLARYLDFSEEVQLIGLALAILGHLKPIMLRFKGGKGISTFIGGIVAFVPTVIPVIMIGFLLLYGFIKSATLAGLGSFLLIPVWFVYAGYSGLSCLIMGIILCLIFVAHYENILERLKKYEWKK